MFCAYVTAGFLIRLRKKLAVVRDGYRCFEDQQTGQLHFVATVAQAAAGLRASSWEDGLWALMPPFPAHIDIDYLMRERQMSRDEALAFVRTERVDAMYKAQADVLNLR